MDEHLIFFDQDCVACCEAGRSFLAIDQGKQFLFAPIEGETARKILIGPNAHYMKADALILAEHFASDVREFWAGERAVFRVYWLLKRYWTGWFCFLPAKICNSMAIGTVEHRHRLHFGWQRPEFNTSRFLP